MYKSMCARALLITGVLVAMSACQPAPPESAGLNAGATAGSSTAGTPAGAAAEGPAAPRRITVAYNAIAAELTPAWLAEEAGLYRKHGLEVELVSMQTAAQVTPALMAGEVSVAYSGAAATASAGLQGADVVLLSSFQPWLRFWLYAKPEIKDVAALRGKRMGVTRLGGGIHLAGSVAAQRAGMDPDRDLIMSQVGGVPDIFTALSSGALDAGWLVPPFSYLAEEAGFHKVVDSLDFHLPYTMAGAAASRRYISQNEEIVRHFMLAHLESLALYSTDKELSKQVMAKWLKVDDAAHLERAYYDTLASMERIPYVSPAAIQTVLDQLAPQMPAARTANPNDFLDNRFIREAEESGFLGRLYP